MEQTTPGGRLGSRSITLKVAPDARYAAFVRAQVLALAAEALIWESHISDFATAVGEALANAVEHAQTDSVIEIRCKIDPWKLIAVITDRGCGFDAKTILKAGLPDLLSERGRGLPLMRRYCDIVRVRSSPGGGTTVKLALLLRHPDHRASQAQIDTAYDAAHPEHRRVERRNAE